MSFTFVWFCGLLLTQLVESKQDGEESSGHLTEKPTTDHDGKDLKGTVEDFTEDDASKESAVVDTVVDSAVADVPVDAPEANGSAAPRTLKDHVAEEEGREYLTTFKTWGAPPAREKPGKFNCLLSFSASANTSSCTRPPCYPEGLAHRLACSCQGSFSHPRRSG